MAERVSPSELATREELADWRVLLDTLDATFDAGSFVAAASFAREVAAAAEAAGHHPDIDLRHPGLVHVVLTTHRFESAPGVVSHGLTTADVGLARTISSLAAVQGYPARPHLARSVEIGIDALDIDAVRPFWKAVLAYVDVPPSGAEGQVIALVDPRRLGPLVWFQQMDAPRPQRNRVHLDITVPHDLAESRVAAALAAGGRLVTAEYARSWWVLADAEGNEACVCTWQDRG